jgi:CRP-like cAMP-binding protein
MYGEPVLSRTHEVIAASSNLLLSKLTPLDYQRLLPHLRAVSLPAGYTLYEAGASIQSVYFPAQCVVSLRLTACGGTDVEVAAIGREGIVGIDSCLGGMPPSHRAEVILGGRAWQAPASVVREDFSRGGALGKLLLRFNQSLHTQTSQAALCCRLHSVEQRLSSVLLALRDRMGTDEVVLTQEEIAHMLGVRRSGVTVAAGVLRAEGLIDYRRGSMTITNATG